MSRVIRSKQAQQDLERILGYLGANGSDAGFS